LQYSLHNTEFLKLIFSVLISDDKVNTFFSHLNTESLGPVTLYVLRKVFMSSCDQPALTNGSSTWKHIQCKLIIYLVYPCETFL